MVQINGAEVYLRNGADVSGPLFVEHLGTFFNLVDLVLHHAKSLRVALRLRLQLLLQQVRLLHRVVAGRLSEARLLRHYRVHVLVYTTQTVSYLTFGPKQFQPITLSTFRNSNLN